MIIYQDTRQQKGKHTNIESYLSRKCVEIVNRKLDVGDYMSPDNPNITVDTKYGLDELAKNLTNREDHARFMREVRRAYAARITLIVLVEQRGIKGTNDVLRWRSKHTAVTGAALVREMFRIRTAYGVKFLFCDKMSTGKTIMDILKGEYHEENG